MKTTLLKSQHERCIRLLELIEKAQNRLQWYINYIARHQMTTWRNELKLWPLGRPSSYEFEKESHNLTMTQNALTRLENYYIKTMKKIEYHAAAATTAN